MGRSSGSPGGEGEEGWEGGSVVDTGGWGGGGMGAGPTAVEDASPRRSTLRCPCRGTRFSHLSSVMSTDPRSRAWLDLDGAALRRNLDSLRARLSPGTGFLPMVKANAYGLGVEGVVARLEETEPWAYGVATTAEGVHLRALGILRPILVFTPPPPGDVEPALGADLILCISSAEGLELVAACAARSGRSAVVHLEIDTGMGRAGVPWKRLLDDPGPLRVALSEAGDRGVRWGGVFTHFHSADEPGSPEVQEQSNRFARCLTALHAPKAGPDFRVHLANSAAALRGLPGWGDPVRPGIHLYGGSVGEGWPVDPVVHLRARVVHVRDASPGDTLGYGATHMAGGGERWATLSVGYGDGLPRALGNRGRALLRGHPVPVVGRVSMDMTVVDVTDLPGPVPAPGEVATLLGRDGEGVIDLDEVAAQSGTISYEVLTGFTPRLPRLWMDNGDGA